MVGSNTLIINPLIRPAIYWGRVALGVGTLHAHDWSYLLPTWWKPWYVEPSFEDSLPITTYLRAPKCDIAMKLILQCMIHVLTIRYIHHTIFLRKHILHPQKFNLVHLKMSWPAPCVMWLDVIIGNQPPLSGPCGNCAPDALKYLSIEQKLCWYKGFS